MIKMIPVGVALRVYPLGHDTERDSNACLGYDENLLESIEAQGDHGYRCHRNSWVSNYQAARQ